MAIESNNWPSWLKEIWPNWLETIGYPSPGVGDLNDLKFSVGVGQNGRWVGFINPGWYYHTSLEQYNFVQVGTVLVSAVSGSGSVSTSSFHPSWGPILLHGVSDDSESALDGPYREHHNSLIPAVNLTWTSLSATVTSILKATIPASSILVNLRNTTNLSLGSVAGTGLLTNEKVYYYDLASSLVYYKPISTSSPNVWADLLYTYPILRFREHVISTKDASGNSIVYPSYQNIENVLAIRGSSVTTLVPGYHASGAIIHSIANTRAGDWVVLDYWISKSFILRNHNQIQYYCGGSGGSAVLDTFKVYYENSIPDILPNVIVNTPASDIFNVLNLNPSFEYGYRTGYLFHGNPASGINSYWVPSKLRVFLDKHEVCAHWDELLIMKVLLSGDNDLPIPYYPVTVSVTGGSSIIQLPATKTNGRGEMFYTIRPHSSGYSSVSVSVSCGSIVATAVATIVSSASLVTSNKWNDGFVYSLVSNDKTGRGALRTFCCATTADGLPRNHSTTIFSKLSSEFHIGSSKTTTKTITFQGTINTSNIQALVEIGYAPQPEDSFYCYSNGAISKIIGNN